ncbi:MAG: OmpA family protein [Pseudomonadales bacterium]|nr:OmpA family protein [Pseudomonadales bacterium]
MPFIISIFTVPLIRWFYLFLLFVPCCAIGFEFITPMENSRWELDSSRYVCRLEHVIAGYGKGTFEHIAGEKQKLFIVGQGYGFDSHSVKVGADPPEWRPNRTRKNLFEIFPERGEIIVVKENVTELLAELDAGMQVAFRGVLQESNHQPSDVFLSAVGFQSAFDRYKRCEHRLLPVNFSQVRRSRVQYKVGVSEIPARGLVTLGKIATYLKEDKSIKQIFVDGHTDNQGLSRDNVTLSQNRAAGVASYLIDLGVAESKIVTRYHGEKYPVKANDTPAHRAVNRRTTIRLSREVVELDTEQ